MNSSDCNLCLRLCCCFSSCCCCFHVISVCHSMPEIAKVNTERFLGCDLTNFYHFFTYCSSFNLRVHSLSGCQLWKTSNMCVQLVNDFCRSLSCIDKYRPHTTCVVVLYFQACAKQAIIRHFLICHKCVSNLHLSGWLIFKLIGRALLYDAVAISTSVGLMSWAVYGIHHTCLLILKECSSCWCCCLQIEAEISKRYKNRRVNIMGEINTIWSTWLLGGSFWDWCFNTLGITDLI